MKTKLMVWIIGLLILAFNPLQAQENDAFAKKLLDEVSQKYDRYKTIMSDFRFGVVMADGESYSDGGTLRLEKQSNKYRIKLKTQEMISDGKSAWFILPEDKEVQITEVDNTSGAIAPNNLFTFYRTGYKYISMEDERENGEVFNVIELSPLETNSNYFKIKLRINKNKHIHDVTVFDKGGSKYTYTIRTLYVNQDINPSFFTFQKEQYTGYDIVDLR